MGTRYYLLIRTLLVLLGVTASGLAEAQSQGRGIRAGNLEIHPAIELSGGYDNNLFLEDDTSGKPTTIDADGVAGGAQVSLLEDPDGSASFRLSPSLSITTLGRERLTEADGEYTPPMLAFKAGLLGNLYFQPGLPEAVDANVIRYDGKLELDELFLPERQFSLGLSQEGSVRIVPLQTSPGYQWHAGAGARTEFGSKGGVLRAKLGYAFGIDRFTVVGEEQSASGFELSDNNFHTHSIVQSLSWKFLPKTALFQEAQLSFHRWASTQGGLVDRFNMAKTVFRGGANGALSKHFFVTLGLGYSAIFLTGSPDDAEGLTALARLSWKPTETFSASVGYGRTVDAALIGNTSVTNMIDADTSLVIAKVFTVGLQGALRFVDFGLDSSQQEIIDDNPALVGQISRLLDYEATASRSDLILDTKLTGEYLVSDWFGITAQLRYMSNFTDYAFLLQTDATGDVLASPAAFSNVSAYLGVRAFL